MNSQMSERVFLGGNLIRLWAHGRLFAFVHKIRVLPHKTKRVSAVVFLLPVFLFVTSVFVARGDSSCQDFLATLHKKPKDLEFQSCKQRSDLQDAPFEASYRVAGSHAAEVESFLAKELKIKKLRRNCCLWESTDNSYRDEEGRGFRISMSTDETRISNRNQ